MKKDSRLLAWLLPPVCFAAFLLILLACSNYCIGFKEQAGIFFFGPDCLTRYMTEPAVLASVLGDLLTRFFFMSEWTGVAISMVMIVLLWLGIDRFMHSIGASVNSRFLAIVPAALECAFVTYPNYPLSATISLVLGVWAAVAVAAARNRNLIWKIACIAGVPVLYVIVGASGALAFGFLILSLTYEKQLFRIIALAEIVLLPILGGWLYNMSGKAALVYPVPVGYITPNIALVALLPLLICILAFIAKSRQFKWWLAFPVAVLSVGLVWISKADDDLEYSIEIGTHAYYGEWDKVREMGRENHGSRYGLFFYNLSFARDGQLPDNLLSIRQHYLADGLFLSASKGENYLSSFYMPMALIEIGDFAQANDCALLGQTAMPGGYSSRMMVTLTEIAIASGQYDVALKYLDILSRTPGYMRWASALKGKVLEGDIPEKYLNWRSRSSQENDVLFAQGDIRSSLKIITDATPLNKISADYLLCSLLLEKRVNTFVSLYERWYLGILDRFVEVPEIYEQALLVNVNSNESLEECVERYSISEKTYNRYMEFLEAQIAAQGNLSRLKNFTDTYWYYIMTTNFVQNEQ